MLSFDLIAGSSIGIILFHQFLTQKVARINYHNLTSRNIDLTPAFHWNIKQLFVFVVAEYESDANVSLT